MTTPSAVTSAPVAPGRAVSAPLEGRWVPFLAGAAFGSTFLNVERSVGEAVLRPFDLLVVASAVVLSARIVLLGRVPRLAPGWPFVALSSYVAYRAVSAAALSSGGVAVAETLQAGELVVYYLVVQAATRSVAGLRSFLAGLVPTVAGIVVWAAFWHVSRGEYFDFKSLGEPKLAFGVLLVLLVALAREPELGRWPTGPWAVGAVTLLVVLSAERKMWIAAGVAVVYLYLRDRPMRTRPRLVSVSLLVLALFVAAGPVIARTLPDGNRTARQISSLADLPLAFDDDEDVEFTSSSNESRIALTRLAISTFREEPVLGVGPDNFRDLAGAYGDGSLGGRSPHNEYLRAAVETGLVGVLLLVSLTVATARSTLRRGARGGAAVPGATLGAGLAVLGIVVNLFLAGGVLNLVFLLVPAAIGSAGRARGTGWRRGGGPARANRRPSAGRGDASG